MSWPQIFAASSGALLGAGVALVLWYTLLLPFLDKKVAPWLRRRGW